MPSCWPKMHLTMNIFWLWIVGFLKMDFNFLWLFPTEIIARALSSWRPLSKHTFPLHTVFTVDLWGTVMPSSDCGSSCLLSQALRQPHRSSHDSFWSFNLWDAINWFRKWSNYTMKCVTWTRSDILERKTWYLTPVSHHSSSSKLWSSSSRHQTVKIYIVIMNILFLYIQPAINCLFLVKFEEKCRILWKVYFSSKSKKLWQEIQDLKLRLVRVISSSLFNNLKLCILQVIAGYLAFLSRVRWCIG